MGGINEVKLLLRLLADDIGIAVFPIKPAGGGSNRVRAATDVNAAALDRLFFNGSPIGLGFGALVHAMMIWKNCCLILEFQNFPR